IVFEILAEDHRDRASSPGPADVKVIPGVSAAQAAAALVGAPLMCDFATISLSDILTPWVEIARRLEAAASSDLVLTLYNPASSRRQHQLRDAQTILLRHRSSDTAVGIVRNASRPGEEATITDLGHLLDHPVDMLTIVIVGNTATIRVGDRLVTRRGYRGERHAGRSSSR
ncbi:MAG: precorrin-3B C(17)-methyltransferase, partial [Chloroflexi bacterium]|nr:precorrin-3B C(17)-methyltransferase [Chloroflexota bacterium]